MRRVLIALLLAPLAVSLCFGLFAVLVYPFMLLVTLCAALPLFLLFRRKGWLEWWHALLAGAICGVLFVAFDTALSYAPDVDRVVNANNVTYVSLGAVIGFVFWWMAIYRNPAFPFVGRAFPMSVLAVLPLAVSATYVRQELTPTFHQGRVVEVLEEPSVFPRSGQVSVRLVTGRTVEADLSNTWPRESVVAHCFHLTERWSTVRLRRIYELSSPFGGGGDDC